MEAIPRSARGAMRRRRISIVRIAHKLDPTIELMLRFDIVLKARWIDRLEGLRLSASLNLDLTVVSALNQIALHGFGTPLGKALIELIGPDRIRVTDEFDLRQV